METILKTVIVIALSMASSFGIRQAAWVPARMAPVNIESRAKYALRYGKQALGLVVELPALTNGEPVYGWWMEDYRSYALPVPLIGAIYGPANHIDCARECRTSTDLAAWIQRVARCRYLMVDWSRAHDWKPYCEMTALPTGAHHEGWTMVTARGANIRLWRVAGNE